MTVKVVLIGRSFIPKKMDKTNKKMDKKDRLTETFGHRFNKKRAVSR
jgi:hypothetical protein